MFKRLALAERSRRTDLKERNPWLTPTEYCKPDETEVEHAKPFRAPLGLPDSLVEKAREREPVHGCQTGVTTKAGSHLRRLRG